MGITQRARGVLRRREPTETVGTRNAVYGPALPEESTVHLVMDLGLRIGEVQMASGAGASDVTATIIGVVSAYGLPHCEVDVIYTSITVSCYRGTEEVPITSLRVVRNRSIDYTRLSDVEDLVREITAGSISASEAYAELDKITSAPHPFPRWVATLAWAGMAASLSVLLGGGDPWLALVAAVATALVDRIGRMLNKRALPFFFQQAVGGVIATSIALACSELQLLTSPALAVAASIIVLLSGMTVVGSMQDAITGYNVTAAGRIAELALMSAGLIAGVVLALYTGVEIFGAVNEGSDLREVGAAQIDSSQPLMIPVQVLAGASTSACFALASYAPPRPLIIAGLGGAVAAGVSGILISDLVGVHPVLAGAIATTVVGFAGGIVTRHFGIPTLVIAVSGVAPLLPGLATYRGLYEIAVAGNPAGMSTLMVAAATGLALGAGVVLGEYLAQPVRTRLGRLERRIAGPRLSGPLRPTRRRLE
ncbi:threonine/serine exporter family protein [Saccharopolyspora sp. NFXS83]|uniref:threonine/serine ThrE exporter family protein n=1 Tax=Saccharopolyspora sp. NFXS83 TaxID=2993560 RepID=UPI00224B048B|nr:threonine/serine exporter family protein [Saccharopolyspora sp. NFXS83]MCX2733689.1 threonine/serine exporter family protein [Saccharopolyspora sp. NFXS83]